jgi:amino acid transporter
MAATRKFGTFEGIFTPSILTILGVIMYLRLPVIVGQAGLWTTLAIIAVAHLISVTTGLSVASVATDKKVQGGGTYYMISRSLGLPIGGTLGIALFVGLSFSVSLYVIGFAESFLGFWGFEVTRNAIRMTGATVLVAVAIVTLISTALALRLQFFILAAIILSLLSIMFGRHEFAPAAAQLEPIATAAPFIVLFAIFFPAVTGFEAGVSMSGDLKDAKKSLPRGTLAAIGVGFVVYVALAVFFATTVDREQLATNPRVLLDISLFAPAVAAGIWGATISSAFGSILGAPRILQATSVDRVTPSWFARTSGRTDEPRRALVLTFLIALSGVMIGELDVIARIVSMFFIATYGFLNLGCAIESWASPDFRPAFRIPRMVSVIGALACLIVMIQLDFIAMIAATVVLGFLYLFLARRHLQLESGDAWRGFWSSVARAALHRLDRDPGHRRNWRPNLLLFVTDERDRAGLDAFGSQFIAGGGLLSRFELVERPDAPPISRVSPDGAPENGDEYGVFGRRIETRDAYGSMEMIARFYGFAGVEPNSTLLEWPESRGDRGRFLELLRALEALQHNILLLRPSPRGFGERRRIDVWTRPDSPSGELHLALVRALTSGDQWRGARVRFLAVNGTDPSRTASMFRGLHNVLTAARVEAQARVIENFVAGRSFVDVLHEESADADLTLLGLPDPPASASEAESFFATKSQLLEGLGAVLLVRASPAFQPARAEPASALPRPDRRALLQPQLADLPLPPYLELHDPVSRLDGDLQQAATSFVDRHLTSAYVQHLELSRTMTALAERAFEELDALVDGAGREPREVGRVRGDLLFHATGALNAYRERGIPEQLLEWSGGADALLAEVESSSAAVPEQVVVEPDLAHFDAAPGDAFAARLAKLRTRLAARITRRQPRYRVPLRALAERRLAARAPRALAELTRRFNRDATVAVLDAQRLLARAVLALDRTELALRAEPGDRARSERVRLSERGQVLALASEMEDAHTRSMGEAAAELRGALRRIAQATGLYAARRDRRRLSGERRWRRAAAARAAGLDARLNEWAGAQSLLVEVATLEARLLALENRVRTIVRREARALRLDIDRRVLARLAELEGWLTALGKPDGGAPDAPRRFESATRLDTDDFLERLLADFGNATADLPERVETLAPVDVAGLEQGDADNVEPVVVLLRALADYRLDTELLAPLSEPLSALSAAMGAALDAARDAVRLASLRFADDEAALVLASSTQRVRTARARVEDALNGFDRVLARSLDRTFEALTPHAVTQATGGLEAYVRGRRRRERLARLGEHAAAARAWLRDRVVGLLYQRSEAVLLTRRLEARARQATGVELRALVASLSPRPEVLAALPFHYRHLFLGKPTFTRDFWTGWEHERRRAADAVEAHRAGTSGALLLLGEPGGGKSALADYIARRHFSAQRVYRVTPPHGGSSDVAELHGRIAGALASAGAATIGELPAGSLVVFDDLDLWWQRTDGGMAVLDEVLALADRHGRDAFFVLTADTHTFRFMNRISDFEPRLLSVLECGPLSARELGQAILFRHGLTGLHFRYAGRMESDLSDVRRAQLFNRIFDHSAGNLGVAFQAWVAGIRAIDGDVITVEPPTAPRLRALDALRAEHVLLLVTLLLHRAVTPDRLARITGMPATQLEGDLATLRRFGVVYADAQGVLAIDRFLRPHLTRRFQQEGLIP